ncbi:MAG: hypothetical protein WBA74_24210 [Cyclobacteriaceae bacterium]
MTDLNISYKPHIYLARKSKKKNSKKFLLSVSVPVCSAFIKSFERCKNPGKKYDDCDVYLIKISTVDIDASDSFRVKPMPELQYIGLTAEIKQVNKNIAVIVEVNDDVLNGHKKDAIHKYDHASEPIVIK